MILDLIHRIRRKLMKMRLQPIRVYCFHHVCAEFEMESMNRGDWMDIKVFKQEIATLQKRGVKFISLTEAYRHICEDWIRCKKYAVLTFDDGYASLKEILPWLEEQQIPCTLFINGKYLDGKSCRNNSRERYLTNDELWRLTSPLIEIGSHGWEHTDANEMSADEFRQSIVHNLELLQDHSCCIPFHAYTWGNHTDETDEYLLLNGIKPVLIDGQKNYNEINVIHRELL